MPNFLLAAAPRDLPWLRPELVAPWWEVALVTVLLMGPFAWSSTAAAFHDSGSHFLDIFISNSRFLENGALEAGLLSAFLFFLHWRGWRPKDFRIRPGLGASAQGIGLFLTTEVVHIVALILLFEIVSLILTLESSNASFTRILLDQVPHFTGHTMDVGWPLLISAMVLNAFMEEMICTGYFFVQIAARQGPLTALLLTVMVRMACHTYQGPLNMLSIGAVFLVYGLWYWWSRNLWILIFAHAVLDLFSTGLLKIFLARFGHGFP